MKFGGTSVGSAVQIRKVAGLIGNKSPKIVVLSAMSGTTNTLVEIAGTLKDGDRFRFGELVGQLEFKYVETVNDLFGTESCRRLAVDGMTDCFRTLWKMPQAGYTPENEKVILAQGELLSTLLMHLCLKEMNIESVVLPALEFMRLGRQRRTRWAVHPPQFVQIFATAPQVLPVHHARLYLPQCGRRDR